MPDWDELLQRDGYKRAPGATDDQLDAAEQALALMFPAELRSLYLVSDGVVDAAGQWFVIWPLDMLIAENLRRRSDQMLPHEAIAFGDNGAGDPFVVFEGQRRELLVPDRGPNNTASGWPRRLLARMDRRHDRYLALGPVSACAPMAGC